MREKSEARFNSSEREQARDKVSILKTRQEYLLVTSWLKIRFIDLFFLLEVLGVDKVDSIQNYRPANLLA